MWPATRHGGGSLLFARWESPESWCTSTRRAFIAAAILAILDDPLAREASIARTLARVRELSWEREVDRFEALIERLDRDGLSSSP